MRLQTTTFVIALLAVGCAPGDDNSDVDDRAAEITDNLLAAGFDESQIEVLENGMVRVGGDAEVTLEASREMAMNDEEDFRQYRTNNLVSKPSSGTRKICLSATSSLWSNSTYSSALNGAVSKLNSVAYPFVFERNGSGCWATIGMYSTSGAGGQSGFPSGGYPYGSAYIGSSTHNYGGVGTVQHVIMHEVGHTMGFRHTDYFNRAISCGSGGNEGDGGVGAILISGTPSGATLGGSVMNSCFRSGESGNWLGSDSSAWGTLY
jgi:hypothetical protein